MRNWKKWIIQKQKIKERNEYSYIIQIIESFGDIFIFILIKALLFNINIKPEVTVGIIVNIFPFFFEIQSKYKAFNIHLIFKIMCVYCLLYSYYDCEAEKEEKQTILEHIIANCQANSKICIS